MKIYIAIFLGIILFLIRINLYSQGCSDAGFCSVGGIRASHQTEEVSSTTISVGTFFGFADNAILVGGGVLDVQHSFSKSFSAGLKVSSLLQSGKQTTQSGVSDIIVNGVYSFDPTFSIIGGIKIPLNSSNKSLDNITLPMDYQSSLGTIDAILGIAYSVNDFQFQIGYQQPLTQNSNEFTPSVNFLEFQNTNRFNRSADALFRASYSVLQNNDWSILVGVLPIYHLANDTYVDNNGVKKEIDGSQGFTVNTNIFLRYSLTKESALELTLASPIITRKSRPDGLTRAFISSLDYKFSF